MKSLLIKLRNVKTSQEIDGRRALWIECQRSTEARRATRVKLTRRT